VLSLLRTRELTVTNTPQQEDKSRDEVLLRAIQEAPEGDLRAFEQLVEIYRKRIVADCRYLTRDENNAEDLAQEVFVKMFFGLRTFEGRSSFRHWLQRVKVYHCLNHIKKFEGKESLSLEGEVEQWAESFSIPPVAFKQIEKLEEYQQIDAILSAMPKTLRIPLVMCDMDEFSYQEIAHSLNISLSSVKMRIKRAREYFRKCYQDPAGLASSQASK
jgi:RNA polymerase sigma-70 factor, ECF subfamily